MSFIYLSKYYFLLAPSNWNLLHWEAFIIAAWKDNFLCGVKSITVNFENASLSWYISQENWCYKWQYYLPCRIFEIDKLTGYADCTVIAERRNLWFVAVGFLLIYVALRKIWFVFLKWIATFFLPLLLKIMILAKLKLM